MKKIKIRITALTRIKELINIIEQEKIPRNIIFLAEESIPFLLDISSLKRLKKIAKNNQKTLEFIITKKFNRDILKAENFTVYSQCPADYQELETQKIEDLYEKKALPPKNKKIARIKPEKPIEETEQAEETQEEVIAQSFTKHKIHNPGREKTSRSKIFFILIFILFLLAGIWLWITPRAVIVIKPKLSPIPIIQNIIIKLPDSELNNEDEELPQVKGVFIDTTVNGSENYTASGRKYDITNSRGKITLFNDTNKPKFLVPSRLSTADGLIFRFKKKVTIPAKKNGKAGKKVVEIVADPFDKNNNPIGYRGNIEAGTELFFPALRPELRELYYAKADKGPLVGGSTLTHYIINEIDEELSANFLTDILQTQAIDKLKNENAARSKREKKQYVLLEDPSLIVKNFQNFVFPKDLIGQEKETFKVSGSLQLASIVFDQTEIEKILNKKLKSVLDDRQHLINLDQSSISYNLLDKENFAENRYLKISVKAIGIKSLDFNVNTKDSFEWIQDLKKQVMGKTENEAQSILINIPEIEKIIDIKISPFWNKKIPNILNRIQFKIKTMI